MLGGRNKHRGQPLGYTIVEVLIVLAVSGMMFLIAANFINGKQAKTSFMEGTNDMVSVLQNMINDVSDGHYSDIPLGCNGTAAGISFPAAGGPSQGSNQSCVFLGKLISFYGPSQTETTKYQIFLIAASRLISGALPQSGVSAIPSNPNDVTTDGTIPQNLYVSKMLVNGTTAYNIGIAQGLGTADVNGDYVSGTQSTGLIYSNNLLNPTTNYKAPGTEGIVSGAAIRPAKRASICLSDEQRYAVIFIGGTAAQKSTNNSNQLSVSVQQFGTTKPAGLC